MSRLILIKKARLLDPAERLDQVGDLLIAGGKIAGFGEHLSIDGASIDAEVIDAEGLCLAPGLVDMRVTFGEPGAEHKETFESGTLAAAAGGITSLACLPNTEPAIDDPAMVEFIARRARKQKRVKVYPYGAITQRCAGEQLAEMALLRQAGAVGFTDGKRPLADSLVMRRAMAYVSAMGGRIIQFPEEPSLTRNGLMNEGALSTRLGLAGIPHEAEVIMVERDLRLAEATGCALHLGPVSTGDAVQAIRQAKARGLPVTADATPAHLTLNELSVEGYRTFAKIKPPLRGEADRLALLEGLVDGTIDVIASDHCPQDQDSKRLPFAQAEFGVVGLETLLPVALGLVHDGTLGLLDLLDKLTRAPADILGLDAGRLKKGAPADIFLFDPETPWRIDPDHLNSLSKNTPFEGRLTQGRVLRTIVDGRTIFGGAANPP
jgi:dihydroorotase